MAFLCFLWREEITLGCRLQVVESAKASCCSQRMNRASRKPAKSRTSSRSSSRSRSSGSSRYKGHYSHSPSLSSCRWAAASLRINAVHMTAVVTQFEINYLVLKRSCLKVRGQRSRSHYSRRKIWFNKYIEVYSIGNFYPKCTTNTFLKVIKILVSTSKACISDSDVHSVLIWKPVAWLVVLELPPDWLMFFFFLRES